MAKRGASIYNRILKEFTKVNNKLPEDRKLSLKERRKIISEEIYPKYKNKPKSSFKITPVKKKIVKILDKIPPKETCDPNLIDSSLYRSIDVFAIDEHLTQIMPNCIYVKVNGGEFGETRIFNTRDYEYEKSGVKPIVESIRQAMEDGYLPSTLDWTGVQKLKPKKANDGTPENYYIEYILVINGEPQGDTEVTKFKLPKSSKPQKTKVTNIIMKRISNVRAKKKKVARVKKATNQAVKQVQIANKKLMKLKTDSAKQRYALIASDAMFKQLDKLQRAYDKGIISKEEFSKLKTKLIGKFGDGGIV